VSLIGAGKCSNQGIYGNSNNFSLPRSITSGGISLCYTLILLRTEVGLGFSETTGFQPERTSSILAQSFDEKGAVLSTTGSGISGRRRKPVLLFTSNTNSLDTLRGQHHKRDLGQSIMTTSSGFLAVRRSPLQPRRCLPGSSDTGPRREREAEVQFHHLAPRCRSSLS
jgi:hypothetical protein